MAAIIVIGGKFFGQEPASAPGIFSSVIGTLMAVPAGKEENPEYLDSYRP
jgi:hypothetical protein